eukprot:6185243-Pleurochrysis_carterae.AAC.10
MTQISQAASMAAAISLALNSCTCSQTSGACILCARISAHAHVLTVLKRAALLGMLFYYIQICVYTGARSRHDCLPVIQEEYWDASHFRAPMYNKLNAALLR